MKAKDPTLELIRSKIRERMNSLTNEMVGGGCEDWAVYKHTTGKIEGLAWAEFDLLEVDEMQHRSDDD